MRTPSILLALVVSAIGCSGAGAPRAGSPATGASTETSAPAPHGTRAHDLVVLANACWFGGLWADAEREIEETRRAATQSRCEAVTREVYGNTDATHVVQLRAFEAATIADLAAKVQELAKADRDDAAHAEILGRLVGATAAAQREATLARRAADRVHRDMDHEADRLSADEIAAVGPLRDTRELEALLALDAGGLTAEARAVGYITAMDRIHASRGLPRHLKVYALSGTMTALFGAPAPDLPTDATKPLEKGGYLTYIVNAARLAGHPVPDAAKTPREREALGWAGMIEGFGDKLKAATSSMSPETPLYEVSARIVRRIDAWAQASRASVQERR